MGLFDTTMRVDEQARKIFYVLAQANTMLPVACLRQCIHSREV
jgi:hypothetical protein